MSSHETAPKIKTKGAKCTREAEKTLRRAKAEENRKKSSKQKKKRSKQKKVRKKAKKNAKKRKKASKVRKKKKDKKDKDEDNDGSEDEGEDSGGSEGGDEGGDDIFPEQDTSLRGSLIRLFRRVFFCFRSPTDVLHEKLEAKTRRAIIEQEAQGRTKIWDPTPETAPITGSTPLSSAKQSSDSQELSKKKNASTPSTSLVPFKSDRFGARFLQKDEV